MTLGKLSQAKSAYKQVFNREADDTTIVRLGDETIFHAGIFPFEDTKLMSTRLAIIDELGNTDAILEYLAAVPDDVFSGKYNTTYAKLFEISKKYVLKETADESDIESTSENPQVIVSEVTNDSAIKDFDDVKESQNVVVAAEIEINDAINKNNNNKSTSILKEEKFMNPVEELKKEALQTGVGADVSTNVSAVSKNDRAAAMKVIQDTQTERMDFSKQAKVTEVLVTKISKEKKAVKGKAAMGTISNPKKALETFISKSGCEVNDGDVTFSKKHSSETSDNLKAMYNILKAACEDPTLEVKPYFGADEDKIPAILKGVTLTDPAGKSSLYKISEVPGVILSKGFLYLNVETKAKAQIQLSLAKPRSGKAPKKSYVIRIANKNDMLEDADVTKYVKTINVGKVSDSKTGWKSDMSVTLNSSKVEDGKTEPKKLVWRIPLLVEQYEVTIEESYDTLFGQGVGNTVSRIELDNESDVIALNEQIVAILSQEAIKGSTTSIVSEDVKKKIQEAKGAIDAASAAEINASLAVDSDVADFEG